MNLNYKFLSIIIIISCLISGIPVNASNYDNTTHLTADSIVLNIEDTYDIDMKGTEVEPYWSSHDINKVSVSQNGLVTGVRKGSTIITARVGMETEKCKVTVVGSSIKLNKKEVTLYTGGTSISTAKLKATVKGASKDVIWYSSNSSIVNVDSEGFIEAKKSGVAFITAMANNKTAVCKVYVKDTSIDLNLNSINLSTKGAGSSIKLVPEVIGSNKKVKWSTSDKKIATVVNGKVTGKGTGKATITATANGISTTCDVIVTEGNVSISEERLVLYTGEIKQLKSNATKKETPLWLSSNEDIVEIDQTGKIKALKAGTSTIRVELNDTYDMCEVVVKDSKIDIGQDKVELHTKGDDSKLQLGVRFTGRSNKVKWTSSDKKIATVNGKGKITAKKEGNVTITATANGVSDTVDVKVFDFIPTIKLNHDQYTLYTGKGNKVSLKATVVGKSKVVDWKSSDSSVATVKNGVVTALKSGNVVITASANGVSEDCTVKVLKSELLLNQNDVYLSIGDTYNIPVDIVGKSKKVIYKTSSSKVASIKNGIVTAKSNGDAVIKVTANGITEEVNIYVSDCKHEWEVSSEIYKLPTCEETGTKLESCGLCNKIKQLVVPKTECKFVTDTVIDKTCTTNGTLIKKCEYCGDTIQEILKSDGHKLGPWKVITTPTDFTEGIEKRYCSECIYEEFNIIDALLHTDAEHEFKATVISPTCTEAGYTEHTCDCGKTYTDNFVDVIEHTWGEWVITKDVTETEDGTKERACTVCNEKETGIVPSKTHSHAYTETIVDATCDEDGYTKHECQCGDSYIDTLVSKLGHNFQEWVKDTENSSSLSDIRNSICTNCNETHTILVTVDALPSHVDREAQLPINITITETVDGSLNSIYVNNNWLEVTEINGVLTSYYVTGNKVGVEDINITKIKIGDKEYDVSINQQVTVNKSCYILENIELDGRDLKFNIVDNDNSFNSLEISICEYDTNKVIFNTSLNEKVTLVNIPTLETNKNYYVTFIKKYNTDEDNTKSIELRQDIKLDVDYNDCISELHYTDTHYSKGDTVSISFNSLNINMDKITGVVVNGKMYDVNLTESTYTFSYVLPLDSGIHTLSMSKLIFEAAEIDLDIPRTLELVILKDKPVITDIEVNKVSDYYATVDFTIADLDEVISSATMRLIHNGNIVNTYEVRTGANSIRVELEPNEEYMIEINAVYNLGVSDVSEILQVKSFKSPYALKDNFTISNFIIKNNKGIETNKIPRNDEVVLEFNLDDRMFNATKVVINSIEYTATTLNQVVTVCLTAPDNSMDFVIESVKDNKENTVPVVGDTTKHINIVKATPSISDLEAINNNNNLDITLTLNDTDSSLNEAAFIKLYANDIEVKTQSLSVGQNYISTPLVAGKAYKVKIFASYSLSDDEEDNYINEIIFEDNLDISLDALDFKAIKSVKLYKGSTEVESFSEKPLSADNYYLEIQPLYAQKLYVDVKSFREDSEANRIYAVADLDGFVSYPNGVQTEGFRYSVEYTGESENTSATTPVKIKSAQELFDSIQANRNGTYELDCDLDAKDLVMHEGYGYKGTFFGKLDGNGYTIYNMPCPMFWGMTGGEVYNLTLDSPKVEGKASFIADIANGTSIIENVKVVNGSINAPTVGNVGGIVAKYEATSTINNCILEGCTIIGNNAVGGIVGALNNSTITDCALIDCSITGNNTVGGLVGNAQGTSVISKTAFMGSVTGTLSGNPNGSRAAGVVGWLGSSSSITNCLIDVELTAPERKGNGGIFGGPLNAEAGSVDKCVVKLVGIDKNSIAGADNALGKVTNVYQLSSNPNIQSGDTLSTINHYDSNYLVSNLGLKKDYADIAESLANPMGGVIALSVMEGYSASKEIAYNNIVKLAPWLDSATVISTGNDLTGDLANKKIISIYPLDTQNKFIHVIDSNNIGSVSKIRVLYEDKTFETLSLTHDSVVSNLVDTYTVNNYSVPYQFNKYIYEDTLELTNKLNSLASGYSYASDIVTVYSSNMINQYDYIYENVVSDNLSTFTKNLVASNFASLSTNTELRSNLESDLTNRLPKLLYGYTYFRKNFGFEMGGVDIADLIYFDAEVLSPSLNLDTLIRALDSYDKGMSNAYNVYETVVKGATGITLYDQLELFLSLGGVSDYDAWLQDYLDCHIISRPPEGYTLTTVGYSLWDNLTNPNRVGGNCHVLAVLTIPKEFQESIGIVSTVGTILFTDIHIYYGNPTEENHVQFQRDLDTMGLLYARYFGTSLGYIPNGEDSLFKDLTIQYDSITSYKKAEYQNSNYSQNPAPMIKWISEVTGKTKSTTAGAVSTGDYIYYGYNQALINLGLFSHENAHSMDGSYFLNNKGRRPGGTYDVEFYTEGFFTEPGSEGIDDISATRAFKHNINDELIAALDYERLNTSEEIKDFYKDLFNAGYAFDTMAGNAFLAGDISLQHKVGKFGYFTEDDRNPDRWNPPVGDKPRLIPFTNYWNDGMNFGTELKTFDDLWTHKISYKGIYGAGNGYERPKFYEINWWTPSNNAGSTDSNTFKRMGYEMLGYAGWEVGMIGWASGQYKSDEEAIRNITGYSGMEEYKKARFTEANDNLYKIPYFDIDAMEEVIFALYNSQSGRGVTPAMDLKALVLNTVKRVTDDFTDGNIHQMTTNNYYEVSTAQELVDVINNNSMKKGVYIKLTDDIDLTGVSGGDGYFTEHFIGIINGDGYTISGLSKPLLKSSKFAMFSDINFEGDASVLVSNSARYTLIYNCYYDTAKSLYVAQGNDSCTFALCNNQPKVLSLLNNALTVSDSDLK